jgi:hypothetical protein
MGVLPGPQSVPMGIFVPQPGHVLAQSECFGRDDPIHSQFSLNLRDIRFPRRAIRFCLVPLESLKRDATHCHASIEVSVDKHVSRLSEEVAIGTVFYEQRWQLRKPLVPNTGILIRCAKRKSGSMGPEVGIGSARLAVDLDKRLAAFLYPPIGAGRHDRGLRLQHCRLFRRSPARRCLSMLGLAAGGSALLLLAKSAKSPPHTRRGCAPDRCRRRGVRSGGRRRLAAERSAAFGAFEPSAPRCAGHSSSGLALPPCFHWGRPGDKLAGWLCMCRVVTRPTPGLPCVRGREHALVRGTEAWPRERSHGTQVRPDRVRTGNPSPVRRFRGWSAQ